ncbi:DUF4279 domain-containing protein [Planctellipticum variicoloris]|uniref:DUF4279 domain-containing protein n=1 Tax=Planctellipticum variicoloris TaxID=3064265 RepID=UPI003013D0C2|nr:DUF4279 domain-containing protein [Planctomycetaceae bacterium SH412]
MAEYESEMLSFGYVASLHIHHPTTVLADMSKRLGLTPRKAHAAGEPRVTLKGTALPGVYSDHYWWCDLRTEDQQDITAFLRRVIAEFKPSAQYLRDIADTGGSICVFIGVGSSRCCAHQFDRKLLGDLAAAGIDLRIDFYGTELPQRGLHPESETA